MSRYSLLTGSLCLMAGLCFGDVVLTPYVSLAGYATTGAVAAVQADLDATRSIATNALALAEGALTTEADTLATVTARGATTTNEITAANFIGGRYGAGAGDSATGDYWGAYGASAGSSASGNAWGAYGVNAGFNASGDSWGAYGAGAGYNASGNEWGAYGHMAGYGAEHTNSHAFGHWAGYFARGDSRLYVDVYETNPQYAADGAINDRIFGDTDGKLYLGRGEGAPGGAIGGTLRGPWTGGGYATTNALADVAAAVAALQEEEAEEADNKALKLYHYGDPNIVESPASWFVFDTGTKTITGYNYVEGRENVVIPWEIGGVAVEVLGDSAFSPDEMGYPITNVVAGRSVLSIGDDAFKSCDSLSSVTLPAATDIGRRAFDSCDSLTNATLPVATDIGDYAFENCTLLTSVTLPAATGIGYGAFENCDSLTNATLPAATSIGGYAFRFCDSLPSVSLPAATGIGYYAFSYCTSLTSATLPAATDIENYAFNSCGLLSSVSLPAAISIGEGAFKSCVLLSSVYFGGNAPSEGTSVFAALTSDQVTVYATDPQSTGWGDTWGGMPVVREALHADEFYLDGDAVSGLLDAKATTNELADVAAAVQVYQASISTHSSSPTTTVSFAEAAIVVVSVTNSTAISVDFSGADYSKGYPVMQVWLDYPALGPVVTLASGNLEYVGDEPDLTVTTAGTRQYLSFMAVGAGRKVLCSKWHQTEGE